MLPLFIGVGECEVMRDQAVACASKVWRDGGTAELRVWLGVYHGSAMFEPGVRVVKHMTRVQRGSLREYWGGTHMARKVRRRRKLYFDKNADKATFYEPRPRPRPLPLPLPPLPPLLPCLGP